MSGPRYPETRGGVASFNLADVHAHDMASMLDDDGVAMRSGQHCVQPLMERLGVAATTRASVYLYTTKEEIDRLVDSVERAGRVFFFSSRRRHTRFDCDWSSDVCSSD